MESHASSFWNYHVFLDKKFGQTNIMTNTKLRGVLVSVL